MNLAAIMNVVEVSLRAMAEMDESSCLTEAGDHLVAVYRNASSIRISIVDRCSASGSQLLNSFNRPLTLSQS